MDDKGETRVSDDGGAQGRYAAAISAVASGVSVKAGVDPSDVDPKSLRVGVNSSLIQQSALAKLLIDKGLVTEEELFLALADEAEREVKRYEEWIAEKMGASVTLR